MENNFQKRNPKSNALLLTGMSFFMGIIGFGFSFIPIIGYMAWGWGLLAVITGLVAFYLRRRQQLKIIWPVISLAIGIITIFLAYQNYMGNKFLVDFMSGGAKGKVDAIIELDEKSKSHEAATKELTGQKDNSNSEKTKTPLNKKEEIVTPPLVEVKPYSNWSDRSKTYYISLVDRLRMRTKPDLESEVVSYLTIGEKVIYLGEKTDVKEEITIAGKTRSDYWYKVESFGPEAKTGWVYGGAMIDSKAENIFEYFPNQFIIPVNNSSTRGVEFIIGRKSYGDYTFHGFATYNEEFDEEPTLDGPFGLVGYSSEAFDDEPGLYSEQHISGTNYDGILDGIFKTTVITSEFSYECEIEFDRGTCQSYKLKYTKGDEVKFVDLDDPIECYFEQYFDLLK